MDKNIMKRKAYSKPCVELVDFSLSGSIAATCQYEGTLSDSDLSQCGYIENGWLVFRQGSYCDIGTDKEFCYHVPTLDNSIFGS